MELVELYDAELMAVAGGVKEPLDLGSGGNTPIPPSSPHPPIH